MDIIVVIICFRGVYFVSERTDIDTMLYNVQNEW